MWNISERGECDRPRCRSQGRRRSSSRTGPSDNNCATLMQTSLNHQRGTKAMKLAHISAIAIALAASVTHAQTSQAPQLDAARKIASVCPDLTNGKYNSGERIIRCRNRGLTEEQQMTFVGGLPILAQAYAASMVQDIYEDNVTDPMRGKAISDYYNACLQRGTPCARPKW